MNKNSLINSTVNEIKQYFSISIPKNRKVLPAPFWIPKMHKLPISNRFIVASRHCVIKTFSKNITVTFKLLYKSSFYHDKSKFYSRVNSFWVIQN